MQDIATDRIIVELTHAEALVLVELLGRWGDDNRTKGGTIQNYVRVEHQAEMAVLWRVEGQLQKQLVEMFDPRYKELIEKARRQALGEE